MIGRNLLHGCGWVLLALVLAGSAVGAPKTASSMRLVVKDKVEGHTLRYMGISGMTEVASREVQAECIKDLGFNSTKYWLIWDRVKDRLSHRRYLYGPQTKAIAIRQATHELEDIDWALEVFGGEGEMKKMADNYAFLKRMGIEPLLNLLAKNRIVGRHEEDVLWRWMFLYHIWANKIKGYNFPLWEVGCENGKRLSMLNSEIGSDALRAAERVTGVKIRVAAAGHDDWKKVALTEVIELLLTGEVIERLDVLSFHGFAYDHKFPTLKGYPTYPEWFVTLENLQKKHCKGKPELPWWDTSWNGVVRPKKGLSWSPAHADLLRGVQSASMFMWQSQCDVEYSAFWRLFREDTRGVVKIKKDGTAQMSKTYYALRMVARAIVSGKERLAVEGAPGGLGFVVLASRDKKKTYLTVINRASAGASSLEVVFPTALKGRPYSVREVGEKINDEQISQGVVPASLSLQVAPLSVKQIIVEGGF